jgi:hypothetical protein
MVSLYTLAWLAVFGGLLFSCQAIANSGYSQATIVAAIAVYCTVGMIVFGAIAARKSYTLRWSRLHAAILEDALRDAEQRRDEYRALLMHELQRENILLAAIVGNAKDAVAQVLKDKKHRLSISLPREHVWLNADTARLGQALSVLLYTAAHHCAEKSNIACNAQLQGGMVRLEIGSDAAMDIRPLPSGKQLAYARVMAELHEGHIEASGDETGFRLIVLLPVVSAPMHKHSEHVLRAEVAGDKDMAARRIG